MRQQGKLQRKHVMERYGISRAELDKSIRDESLKFNKNGWANLADVEKWADAKGHKPITSMVTNDMPDGGKLFGGDVMDVLGSTNFPEWFIKKVSDASDVSKSLTAAIAAQDKQMRNLRETGRLGDLNEIAALLDGVIEMMVKASESLPNEMSAEIANNHKVKGDVAKAILYDVRDYLLKAYESALAELESQVVKYQQEKSAETRMKAKRG